MGWKVERRLIWYHVVGYSELNLKMELETGNLKSMLASWGRLFCDIIVHKNKFPGFLHTNKIVDLTILLIIFPTFVCFSNQILEIVSLQKLLCWLSTYLLLQQT